MITLKKLIVQVEKFLASDTTDKTVAFYQQGYHMLLRDLQAPTAWKDIAVWITDKPQKLPSGADNRARQILAELILQPVKAEE